MPRPYRPATSRALQKLSDEALAMQLAKTRFFRDSLIRDYGADAKMLESVNKGIANYEHEQARRERERAED